MFKLLSLAVLLTLILILQTRAHAGGTANLDIVPPAPCLGDRMELAVVMSTPSPVAGVQVFLDFNPDEIRILSIQGVPPLNDWVFLSVFDNERGEVGYAAGNLPRPWGSGFPAGDFTVFVTEVERVGNFDSTSISFSTDRPRDTLVAAPGGLNVTGDLTDLILEGCNPSTNSVHHSKVPSGICRRATMWGHHTQAGELQVDYAYSDTLEVPDLPWVWPLPQPNGKALYFRTVKFNDPAAFILGAQINTGGSHSMFTVFSDCR